MCFSKFHRSGNNSKTKHDQRILLTKCDTKSSFKQKTDLELLSIIEEIYYLSIYHIYRWNIFRDWKAPFLKENPLKTLNKIFQICHLDVFKNLNASYMMFWHIFCKIIVCVEWALLIYLVSVVFFGRVCHEAILQF